MVTREDVNYDRLESWTVNAFIYLINEDMNYWLSLKFREISYNFEIYVGQENTQITAKKFLVACANMVP